ncbi:histidine kinase [Consotaella aegiceratis]|uniref:histidine kinase n=1 Tax=Consotaella aegiceratis TaxID=3097961 RepID=UPI002F40026A
MPTLVRLLTTVLIIAGLVYGAMAALVMWVHPVQRPVVVDIPLPQLDREAGTEQAQP